MKPVAAVEDAGVRSSVHPGPLVSARFSVVRERKACLASLCPFGASCQARGASFECRPRLLLLRANGAVAADAVQVASDLLRDGLMVFTCRKAPCGKGWKTAAFLACVCDSRGPHPAGL